MKLKFRVTLARTPTYTQNPFLSGSINSEQQVELRVWHIDANSEQEIRDFFKEAKDKGMPNVIGFDLRYIEVME